MPVAGKHRCGCDCKNQTITPDSGPHNVCCLRDPVYGTPTKYAVLFECEHDWPLYTTLAPDSACPALWPVGVYPSITSVCDPGPGISPCSVPDGLAMTHPVLELKKDCVTPTFDGQSQIQVAEYNQCSYSNVMYVMSGATFGSGCLLHSIFDSKMADVNNPSAGGRLFPPYKTGSGGIEYVEGDYERDSALVHAEYYNGPWSVGQERAVVNWVVLWHLNLGVVKPYLEWTYDYVLNRMNSGAGKPRPRYVAADTWSLWGRNTMVLTNPEDWPTLRSRICVAAIGKPKVPNNPCSTHAQRCLCCDPGNDVATFYIELTGCIAYPPGSIFSATVVAPRINPTGTGTGSTDVPCGVTVPSGVCGFFWFVVQPDTQSEPCPPSTGTGPYAGLVWTGRIGVAVYCTGTGTGPTGGPPMAVDMYCEYDDGGNLCYAGPVSGSVTFTGCFCLGWGISWTANELPCCCQGISTCCCESTIPVTLTAEVIVDGSSLGLPTESGDFPINGDPDTGVWTGSGGVGSYGNVIISFECVDLGTGGCFIQVSLKCDVDATTWVLSVTEQNCPPGFEVVANGGGLGFCFMGLPVTVVITG